MTDNAMLEKCARALMERDKVFPGNYAYLLPGYKDEAILVIRALMEPTDEMVVAGDGEIIDHLYEVSRVLGVQTPAESCWRAMLRTLLPEEPRP